MNCKALMLTAAALAMIAACERPATESAATDSAATAEHAATEVQEALASIDYAAVVATPSRSDADRARDALRKPAEALAFFEIAPGDNVFEVEAGGGYYTELYSLAVGSEGAVVMQNFQGFADYAKDEIATRLADNRLANVRVSISMHDALDAADNSVDVATWVLGPHELYYKPAPDANLGDPVASFAEIYRIVKPGGVFAVVDHAALAGAPVSVGDTLHRADQAHIVDLATGAGFALEAQSDFLANPDDDHTISVFDASIAGKTDQFALRFRKPE